GHAGPNRGRAALAREHPLRRALIAPRRRKRAAFAPRRLDPSGPERADCAAMERAHTWPSLCTLVGMARRSPHTQPARAVPSALAVALGLVLGLSACGSSAVSRGASYYAEGRYIDAAQVFEQTEPRLSGYDGGER